MEAGRETRRERKRKTFNWRKEEMDGCYIIPEFWRRMGIMASCGWGFIEAFTW